MKSGIIISRAGQDRYPWLAFTLSFFFTGLGQVYNGDLAKGIVFFMLRIFTFVYPVAVIMLKNYDSYIFFFGAAAFINILIWILSPVEAMYTARGLDAVNLKKYNSEIFYILYGIFNVIVLFLSIYFISLFISIEEVTTDEMNPAFSAGEYILVNKYSLNKYDVGDVVFYSDDGSYNTGRIIAKGGEEYRYEGNKYYINDFELRLGILSDEEMERLGLSSSGDLFYETNGKRKYPVKVFIESDIEKTDKNKKAFLRRVNSIQIKKGMLLLSRDDRTSEDPGKVVNTDAIKGRVEGVFLTFNLGRFFLKPYFND